MGGEIALREISVEVHNQLAEQVAGAFLLGHQPNTRKTYACHLRQWFKFCRQHSVDPLSAGRVHVDAWVNSQRAAKAATLANKVAAVRNFYRYAVDQKYMQESPVPAADKVLHLPTKPKQSSTMAPDKDEARRLLAVAAERGARDYMIVSVLLHQGLRASELVALNVQDLWQERGEWVWRLQRKGGKEERQVVHPRAVAAIHAYLNGRTSGPLVLRQYGGRLGYQGVRRVVIAIAEEAKARHFTPHSFRHACVTMLFDEKVPARDIQVYMGHENLATTERYDRGRRILTESPAHALTGVFD